MENHRRAMIENRSALRAPNAASPDGRRPLCQARRFRYRKAHGAAACVIGQEETEYAASGDTMTDKAMIIDARKAEILARRHAVNTCTTPSPIFGFTSLADEGVSCRGECGMTRHDEIGEMIF